MADRPDVPQFGALLREHIQSVPAEAQPAFLAGLERSAAQRYRDWIDVLPAWADVLDGCARREDQIADIISARFPVSSEHQAQIDAALPDAVALYYDVFAPYSPHDQVYLQSEAEIQGSQAWVRMADAGITDPDTLADLERCTALELESSHAVKRLLDEPVAV
ncbi:MAG: hypothetical protein WA964_16925 [Ilumatobacter sp.]|uniref:hypothetical protein n=1 Tax=Ilumatobacter sp. TaxID=1967498 RepID=UPI003C73DB4E